MHKIFLSLALSFSLFLQLSSQQNVLEQPFAIRENETSAEYLHRFSSEYWKLCLRESPESATTVGEKGYDHLWTDLSVQSIARRKALRRSLYEAFLLISPQLLSKEDLINYEILQDILESDLAASEFPSQYLLIDQMWGIHNMASLILNVSPQQTAEDYENILSRLRQLPVHFEQATFLLKEGLSQGITPPKATLGTLSKQILLILSDNPQTCPYLSPFYTMPSSISAEDQERLKGEAEKLYFSHITPALKNLSTFIHEEYVPNARTNIAFSSLPNGQKWYAHLVQGLTNTALTPEDIHALGLKEVERIYRNILEVKEKLGFDGTYEEFLTFLKTDPQFFYATREEFLQAYETTARKIEGLLPKLFVHLPSLPFEVKAVPPYEEESVAGAYYNPGSVKEKRPGIFYINTHNFDKKAKWEVITLSLHEAVPGHHLQISLAQEIENMPEFRKHCSYTSYIEGWGLYSESLGKDLSLYNDPYDYVGYLNYEMMRALRLVVDTGMHAFGWTKEEAINYFKKYIAMNDHEIENEINRYLVIPAQALAYKIGELKTQEMRRYAQDALGSKFDIRDFHNQWLKNGTVPLNVAEKAIRDWVEETI